MTTELNVITVVNPSKVTTTTTTIGARNMTYIGPTIYHHKLINFALEPKKQVQHIITVEWEELSLAELATLKGAVQASCLDYVQLLMDGLQVISGGAIGDSIMVMSQQAGLDVTFNQGYTSAGDGPVIYDARCIFVSAPTESTL